MPPKSTRKATKTYGGTRRNELERRAEGLSRLHRLWARPVMHHALLHQTAEGTRSTSAWIIYLQHHRSFHSRHRIAKATVESRPQGQLQTDQSLQHSVGTAATGTAINFSTDVLFVQNSAFNQSSVGSVVENQWIGGLINGEQVQVSRPAAEMSINMVTP